MAERVHLTEKMKGMRELPPEAKSSPERDPEELFGASYFAKGCGPIPYERSEGWLGLFASIADHMVRCLKPARVLDAGCAMGFLVEALWDRGVEAYGIDISSYAIARVRPDIRPYCRVASVTEPIEGRFDLITCIEVLEHLEREDARRAVRNLCLAADTILFSSTPTDFMEPTHFNVQPPLYWLRLFAEFDFWPDLRFDATVVAPHAFLLRKGQPAGPDDMLASYCDSLRLRVELAEAKRRVSEVEGELEQQRRRYDAHRVVQLYWREAGGNYQEANSVKANLLPTETVARVQLRIPAAEGTLDGLRLDPADRTGLVRLHRACLRREDESEIWNWPLRPEHFRSERARGMEPLPAHGAGEGVTLLLTGSDPSVELPLATGDFAQCAGGAVLEVDLSWPNSVAHAREWIERTHEMERRRAETLEVLRITRRMEEGLAQPLERLRVLFVTACLDAPFRYRCENACLQLRAENVVADLATITYPALPEIIARYSILVLFRIPWEKRVEAILERAHSAHTSVVFDIDDLIFTGGLETDLPFLREFDARRLLEYTSLGARLRKTIQHSPFFIGSTPELVEAAQAEGRLAFQHPNLLHPEVIRIAAHVRTASLWLRQHMIISYLSGSNTHDPDLHAIAPALATVLKEVPDAFLLLAGFVETPAELNQFGSRILRVPYLDWRVLPWLQGMARCNLAPSAEINRFTNSKSPLKFFEAGITGVPTVASPTKPMKAAIRSGENGFLAESQAEWTAAIKACLDLATSRRLGRAAWETSMRSHSHSGHPNRLQAILRRFVQPEWEMPQHRPDLPLHGLLEAEPGATLGQFSGNPGARIASITSLLWAAAFPTRLSRGAVWMNPKRTFAATAFEPFQADSRRFGPVPAETLLRAQAAVGLEGEANLEGPLALSWRPTGNPPPEPQGHGWYKTSGAGASLLSCPLAVDLSQHNGLLLTLAAEAAEAACAAKLYWSSDADAPAFAEERSIAFPVVCDGEPHWYLVSLNCDDQGNPTSWRSGGMSRYLRFDPLDSAGLFRIERMLLI